MTTAADDRTGDSPQSGPASGSVVQRMRRFAPYFGTYPGTWLLVAISAMVAAATEPLIPALLKPLLDRGFQQGALPIWTVPVSLLLLFGVRGLAGYTSQIGLSRITNDGLVRMRRAMFEKILDARMDLFTAQSSSALSNTVVFEVQTGATMLVNSLLSLTRNGLTLLALTGYLLYLNWKLTMIVALMFPAVAWVMRVLTRRLHWLTKANQDATDELAYVVEENVLAHREIRLYSAQPSQLERFGRLGEGLQRLALKSTIAGAAMTPMTQMLAAVALSAVISVALVQSSSSGTSVGGFVAFVTAMLMIIAPIRQLSEVSSPITRGLVALERGLALIEDTRSESGGTFEKPVASGAIEFRQVGVRYQGAIGHALQGLDLQIAPGETVALVGASGSGKTTLANLLPRFIERSDGAILLDGHDIQDWSLHALRRQFAFVSQNVVMLNASIADNVALGLPVDRDRVAACLATANLQGFVAGAAQGLDTVVGHNALQLSGGQRQRLAVARALYKNAPILILDEATSALDTESERAIQDALRRQFAFVSQNVVMLNASIADNVALGLPVDRDRVAACLATANLQGFVAGAAQGLDTVVGHNALQLSGGQRQRLAVARALYKNAPILILDEATSALDTESERAIQDALQVLMRDRTTLVIAHRLSTIQHADRIVVMDAGRIVEIGSHAQLLARDGVYARLYQLGQQGGGDFLSPAA